MDGWTALLAAVLVGRAGMVPLVGSNPATEDVSGAATHHVHIQGFDMQPSSLTIQVGDTVTWHNHDGASHTATDDGGDWDTGIIPSGGTASLLFDATRDDTYHCDVHPSMNGFQLQVTSPNQPPAVTFQAPSPGEELSGTVEIEGTASDPDGTVEQVEVRIDGGPWQVAQGTSAWSLTWDTRQVLSGEHTLEARSDDGAATSPAASLTVTTDNPHPDLAVETLEVEQAPGQATITVTLANRGQTASPATSTSLSYTAERAQGLIGDQPLEALEVGQTASLTFTWQTLGKIGAFELTALADPSDEVVDPVAGNDALSQSLCVPELGGVTCQVGGTEVGPLPAGEG